MTELEYKSASNKESGSSQAEMEPRFIEKPSSDVQIGQLKLRIENFEERFERFISNGKWIVGAGITLISLAIAFVGVMATLGVLVLNVLRDTQNSYRDLQNTYYQEMLQVRKELQQIQLENHDQTSKPTIRENKK